MLIGPFEFDILDKKGLRKSRNISEGRTLLDVSKYTAAGNARFLKNHVKYRSSFPCTRASGKSRVSWNIPHHIDGTHGSILRFYNGTMYVNPISQSINITRNDVNYGEKYIICFLSIR